MDQKDIYGQEEASPKAKRIVRVYNMVRYILIAVLVVVLYLGLAEQS